MIRSEDVFNAHRVVRAPSEYRRRSPGAMMTLPAQIIDVIPTVPIRDARRRATLLRVVQRNVNDRVKTLRNLRLR